jgi:hypothetical protein
LAENDFKLVLTFFSAKQNKTNLRNTKAKRVLKTAEKEAGNVLEAFLILPIQRIPRYILLLKVIILIYLVDYLFIYFILFYEKGNHQVHSA